MICGRYVSAKEGVSEKTGNAWYMVRILAKVDSAQNLVMPANLFVEKDVYQQACGIARDKDVVITCGINNFGKLTVKEIAEV